MSKTSSQRGRVVAKQRGSLTAVYVILGLVALVGLGLIGYYAFNRNPTQTTASGTSTGKGLNKALEISSFPFKGKADAPVTVIEYGDYQCPACGYFATSLEAGITKEYVDTGKVKFIFHEYPLPQHKNAIPAAEAARCMNEQGKYWEMHDQLYARQTEWENLPNPAPNFSSYAAGIAGTDVNAFNSCLLSRKYKPTIEQAGIDADGAGINSTPTFVINGKNFGMNDLKAGIDAALAGK